jgi:hypothetical protein
MKALLGFDQRHGREDNLMYRANEEGRESIKNEINSAKLRKNKLSQSDYNFRVDFLKLKK